MNGSSNTPVKYLKGIRKRSVVLYEEFGINSKIIRARKSEAMFQMRQGYVIGVKGYVYNISNLMTRLQVIMGIKIESSTQTFKNSTE